MENYIGAIYGLPNNTYHEHSALGSSGFKLLNRTPAHYYARYLDPNREIKPQTEAQRIGTMIHTATLEPHKFDEQFIVLPEGLDRRTKEGKALWDEIIASGKEPLKPDDLKLARATSSTIHAHPLTRVLFDQCDADTEVSLFAIDPETGVLIKIRPDIMVEPCDMFPNGLIVDVKSTDDASPAEFGRSVWNWEMYYQAALYPRVFMQVFGTKAPPSFMWCAVEKSAPYAVKYHNCNEALTDYGNMQVDRLLDVYAECIASGVWPGYDTEVSDIVLPAWAENIILGAGEDDIKEISYV